jgi:hypothetical protein
MSLATATVPYLEYSDKHHKYWNDGREIPSVTQILNRAGLVSPFAMDGEAQWRGSEVHRLCAEEDLSGISTDLRTIDPRLRGFIRAWRLYRQESGFLPVEIEKRIDDPSSQYSGRLDRAGIRSGLNGETVSMIIDLKTSKAGSVADYVRYQLVAYAHAFQPGHIFERVAVALKPDGRYNCRVYPTTDFQTDLHKWFHIVRSVKEQS